MNLIKANSELNIYRDLVGNKLRGEIDRKGLKQLTSALKDLNDVLIDKKDDNKEYKIDNYLSKLECELHD